MAKAPITRHNLSKAIRDAALTSGAQPVSTGQKFRDWRMIDPALLRDQGEGIQTYREKIDELLLKDDGRGSFVLIVDRNIIALFPDLHEAVRYADLMHPDQQVFIKQITAFEPIQSLGGADLPGNVPAENH